MSDESVREGHDLFPVAMDYEGEFLLLKCAECGQRFWRNLHQLEPDGDESDTEAV